MIKETLKIKTGTLVVILSGYTLKKSAYKHVVEKVMKANLNASVFFPKLGITLFSSKDPNQIADKAITDIDQEWGRNNYNKLIIIGHSCGALLARKVYLYACGENKNAPFERPGFESPRVWAKQIERIILFAGMNRGWTVNRQLSFIQSILWRIGITLANLLSLFNYNVFITKLRRGTPFISQMRIQWLSMLESHLTKKKNVGGSMVIQLLGTIDDLVSPDDNIDLVTGSNFYYLEVPYSGHMTVLDMDSTDEGIKRAEIFDHALLSSPKQLSLEDIDSYDRGKIVQNKHVTDVVFVVHGIRDAGYWTSKVASRVQSVGNKTGKRFETETSSYGYFPILSFLLYRTRKEKVEWLMDRYTENLALYPNADFSFVGHSNGTYLLAKALQEYPACKFKNVVFAGSVVRSSYDWNKVIREKRVGSITNLVASADWVVAIFPKAFESIGWQDLGSAGHDGFINITSGMQIQYLQGAHGVGVKEKLWNNIADYAVYGNNGNGTVVSFLPKRSAWVWFIGYIAPVPLILIIVTVFFIGFIIFNLLSFSIVFQLIGMLFYTYSIWKVITRF